MPNGNTQRPQHKADEPITVTLTVTQLNQLAYLTSHFGAIYRDAAQRAGRLEPKPPTKDKAKDKAAATDPFIAAAADDAGRLIPRRLDAAGELQLIRNIHRVAKAVTPHLLDTTPETRVPVTYTITEANQITYLATWGADVFNPKTHGKPTPVGVEELHALHATVQASTPHTLDVWTPSPNLAPVVDRAGRIVYIPRSDANKPRQSE